MKDIFDREALLERVGGDETLANELVELFLQDVPDRLKVIHQAQDTDDIKTIIQEAHTIKGSSSNIGANNVTEAALQVELAGKNKKQEAIPSLVQSLEEAFKMFEQFVNDANA